LDIIPELGELDATTSAGSQSRTLRICLQIAFCITTLASLGALLAAKSVLSALAVIPIFALSLFPISNNVLIFWIVANRKVRRTLAGDILVNTPTFANLPRRRRPRAADLAMNVTVQIPVYTEGFATIRETIENAMEAVSAYNDVSDHAANVVISDDALMIWADNDLPGSLERARSKPPEQRSDDEAQLIERVEFYRRHQLAFVARPRPVPGCDSTTRRGRFKKAGNINRTIHIANAIAELRAAEGIDYGSALERVLKEDRFRYTHAEGTISIGDLILMLDKDSTTPRDALILTVPEFIHDRRLAYTQHKTNATNAGDNYFAGIMGVYTRLVFRLGYPAKALQGWMPPFMGHNGFVRKSVLAGDGYWSEDRVGEDLDFTMWAVASGGRGKYIAIEGAIFGEQVTRTYAEEAGKYHRYGFSILELILNPVGSWLQRGVFTERFKRYMRSDKLGWEHKLDLIVIYPFFYINLALIPLMAVFIPFADVNFAIYVLFFLLSLAPPLLLASQQDAINRSDLGKRLFQFQAMGFLFISYGLAILRGFAAFFAKRSEAKFGVTSIDSLDYHRKPREILGTMTPQLRAAGLMVGLAMLSFVWAYHVDKLNWTHFAASLPVIVSVAVFPFLMSPGLLSACRKSLSS
jgi:cellulose synthase/poly-beta-1,6-N-acetylglucosamine synthase-like glycosyltransferase